MSLLKKHWIALLALAVLLPGFAIHGAVRPNIVFILTDDQRADTVHALGNRNIQTPNLDRLVRGGLAFERAYCMGSTQGAVCVPSRAMILTGRSLFHATTGTNSGAISTNHPTLPEHFRKSGYETVGIGKWHNDRDSFIRSFSKGGPIFFGGMTSQSNAPLHEFSPAGDYPKEGTRKTNAFTSELFADSAVKFIEDTNRVKPMFLYLSFTAPHDPRTAPEPYASLYNPARMPLPKNFLPWHPFNNGELNIRDEKLLPWPRTAPAVRKELADYYAAITHLDVQIGKVLEAIENSGMVRNTIVVFTSDHGLAIGSHGLLGKQNLYEHSVRAPLIISGPGIPRDRRTDAMCYLYDLYPTLCNMAGLDIPPTVEGGSLLQIIQGRARKAREEIFCAYGEVQRSIRGDRFKLIHYPRINRYQLFDLKRDPSETRDLIDHPRRQDEIQHYRARLIQAARNVGDPLVR